MSTPQTLLQLSGASLEPAILDASSLVLIDMQYEYTEGPLALPDVEKATVQASALLAKAREAGSNVVHVFHRGGDGGLFDRNARRGQAIDLVAPHDGEAIVEKSLPNAFAGTELKTILDTTANRDLIIVGFMTHMCVSSTARAAIDHGFRVTIDAESCATRDLPDGKGSVVDAATLHSVALTELSDRFAIIARDHY